MQPVRRYGVDAAILFSDIVVPVAAIGFGIDIRPGTGPVVDQPFAAASDLARLRPLEPEVDRHTEWLSLGEAGAIGCPLVSEQDEAFGSQS